MDTIQKLDKIGKTEKTVFQKGGHVAHVTVSDPAQVMMIVMMMMMMMTIMMMTGALQLGHLRHLQQRGGERGQQQPRVQQLEVASPASGLASSPNPALVHTG